MTALRVFEWPSKVLDIPGNEVILFDDALRAFVADMHDTMKETAGIGLAANQVGDLRRIVTIEIPSVRSDKDVPDEPKWWHNKRFTFINPVVTKSEGTDRWQEGCLSFPDIFDFVERASEVWVKAFDEFGKEFEVHADGLFAVCLQHEIDHINGIVFFKRMSKLKSDRIKTKMIKRGNIHVDA
jgi:peptide deformylase